MRKSRGISFKQAGDAMKVQVLKVRGKDNLTEMEQGIAAAHTVDGWLMPKTALPGDLAIWYAASPVRSIGPGDGW